MYIVDTSIFSYLFRNDPIVSDYADDLKPNTPLFLSVQTIGELRVGAASRQWGKKRLQLLSNFIATFGILPITKDTAKYYAEIIIAAKRSGKTITVPDAWIIASAKQFDLALVSHDRDMILGTQIGIQVICRA